VQGGLQSSLDLECSDGAHPILCHKPKQHVSSNCRSRGVCAWADAVSCFGSCLAILSRLLGLGLTGFRVLSRLLGLGLTGFRVLSRLLGLGLTGFRVLSRLLGLGLIGFRGLSRLLRLGLTGFRGLSRLLGLGLTGKSCRTAFCLRHNICSCFTCVTSLFSSCQIRCLF